MLIKNAESYAIVPQDQQMKPAKTWAKEFLSEAPFVSRGTVEAFVQNVQADARVDLLEDIEDLVREIGRLETLLKAHQKILRSKDR